MVLDSAFSNLYVLMMELVDVYKIRLPKFTVQPLFLSFSLSTHIDKHVDKHHTYLGIIRLLLSINGASCLSSLAHFVQGKFDIGRPSFLTFVSLA